MYLKRVELQGFKSFADKTILELMPGITTVIGPNGSGKSTITQFFEKVGTYTNADDIVANIKELMRLCDILHVYDNTIQPIRIIRKHKEDISIFPNKLWTEEALLKLIGDD